jgi:acyl transferase domain-containing protein
VKANIGHLEGGSGLAGILKSILILEKGLIPPNANFEKENPELDTAFYNTKVNILSMNLFQEKNIANGQCRRYLRS